MEVRAQTSGAPRGPPACARASRGRGTQSKIKQIARAPMCYAGAAIDRRAPRIAMPCANHTHTRARPAPARRRRPQPRDIAAAAAMTEGAELQFSLDAEVSSEGRAAPAAAPLAAAHGRTVKEPTRRYSRRPARARAGARAAHARARAACGCGSPHARARAPPPPLLLRPAQPPSFSPTTPSPRRPRQPTQPPSQRCARRRAAAPRAAGTSRLKPQSSTSARPSRPPARPPAPARCARCGA